MAHTRPALWLSTQSGGHVCTPTGRGKSGHVPLLCLGASHLALLCVRSPQRWAAVVHLSADPLPTHHRYNGALGLHFLQDEALGLAPVVEPPPTTALAQALAGLHVFGSWFPPAGLHRGGAKGRDS